MAGTIEIEKIVEIQKKELSDVSKNKLAMFEKDINVLVSIRNQYLFGIADAMGLDEKWKFDSRSQAFVKDLE